MKTTIGGHEVSAFKSGNEWRGTWYDGDEAHSLTAPNLPTLKARLRQAINEARMGDLFPELRPATQPSLF